MQRGNWQIVKNRQSLFWGVLALIALVCFVSNRNRFFPPPYSLQPQNPLIAQLAPGAPEAIERALGQDGLTRVSQVVSANNEPNWYSGGTHMASGSINGRLYGLAFDIVIDPMTDADEDTRKLRLQGIAAWHRGDGASGGEAGMGPHIHCVWPGAPSHNRQNGQQIASFLRGWRGLVGHARGRPMKSWRDLSIRKDEIEQVRMTYERVHGRASADNLTPYEYLHSGASRSATTMPGVQKAGRLDCGILASYFI